MAESRARAFGNLARSVEPSGAITSSGISTEVSLGVDTYDSLGELPVRGLTNGDQAFVGNRLYISNGSGWYNVGLVNLAPSIVSGPDGASFELDSTNTVSLSLTAVDSDGTPIIWSFSASDSASDLATITNDSEGSFNVTGKSLVDILSAGYDSSGGSFSITFTASDGISFDTDSASFSLTYSVAAGRALYDWASASDVEVVDAPPPSRYNGAFGSSIVATEDYIFVGDGSAVISPNTKYVGSVYPYSLGPDGTLTYVGQSTPQNPVLGWNMGARWRMDAVDDPNDTSIPVKYTTGTNDEIVYINGVTSGGSINGGQSGYIKRLNAPTSGIGWGRNVALGKHPAGSVGQDMFLVVGAYNKNSTDGGIYIYNSNGNNNQNWPFGNAPDYTIDGPSGEGQGFGYPVSTSNGWIVAFRFIGAFKISFFEPTTSMAWNTTPQVVTCVGAGGTTLVTDPTNTLEGHDVKGDYAAIASYESGSDVGVVCVIKLIDGTWTEYATLTAPPGYGNIVGFGFGVALHEDGLIAIGSTIENQASAAGSSTSDPDWQYNANTVFVFEDNGSTFEFKGIAQRQSGTTTRTSTRYGFSNVDSGEFSWQIVFSADGDLLFVSEPDARVSPSSNYGGVIYTYEAPAK